MDWTPEQIALYQKLMDTAYDLSSLRELAPRCFKDATFAAPCDLRLIENVEKAIGRRLPSDLSEFYLESNGLEANYGSPYVMPIERLEPANQEVRDLARSESLYMPFDSILFFGAEGNGDLFGYAIHGTEAYGAIYKWDHESDSRIRIAQRLRDFLIRSAVNISG